MTTVLLSIIPPPLRTPYTWYCPLRTHRYLIGWPICRFSWPELLSNLGYSMIYSMDIKWTDIIFLDETIVSLTIITFLNMSLQRCIFSYCHFCSLHFLGISHFTSCFRKHYRTDTGVTSSRKYILAEQNRVFFYYYYQYQFNICLCITCCRIVI